MLKKRHVVIVFLTFCLTAAIFIGASTSQVGKPFDPWFDAYDDGKMNYDDLFYLADRYGTSGTAINKTELLCCLTRGNISVPAASFVPQSNDKNYLNNGGTLYNYEAAGYITFYAGVQLPDGATVTKFTSYWYDDNASNIPCFLSRRSSTGGLIDMATAFSSGDLGPGSTSDYLIYDPIVDNGLYGYCVEVSLPASPSHYDYRFNLAVIEWEYTTLP